MRAAETLNDTVHTEVERELSRAGIRKLSQFGWLNADDPDPEYLGHAKWHVDPPFKNPTIFNARAPFSEIQPASPDWLKRISVIGADFEGLMEAARMSIGLLMLSIHCSRSKEFFDDAFIDLHRMSALIYLSAASDRLREFFIAAAFRVTQDRYDKPKTEFNGNPRSWYSTAFEETAVAFPNLGCLARVLSYVPEIREMRKERNTLIHEVATALALRERETQKVIADNSSVLSDFKMIQMLRDKIRAEFFDHQTAIVTSLATRYSMLVSAIGETFDFENQVRHNEAPLPLNFSPPH
jgi:hypothetical protein